MPRAVSRVSRSASSSIHASISTRPVAESCTIAGFRRHRSATPSSRSSLRSVRSRAGSSCRIDASSAACAIWSASATWLASPAPPEAITGRSTAPATARGQLEVVAVARPVGVDRREQDLPRPARLGLACPLDRGAPRLARAGTRANRAALGVDRNDDGLRAELLGKLRDQLRPRERRRVDSDLVGAGRQQLLRVGDRAHTAADRERDREPLGDSADELDERRRGCRASPSRRGTRARRRPRPSTGRRARQDRRRRAAPETSRP